jgi:hypothetical protein
MSKFTDFVNEELPKRPVLIKGEEEAAGDPNISELSKVNMAPIGSFYMQFDAGNKLWQKMSDEKEGWQLRGSGGGASDPSLQALKEKKLVIPQIFTTSNIVSSNQLQIPIDPLDEVVPGEVDVVDQSTGQVVMSNGVQVTGTVNSGGMVSFSSSPNTDIRIVYGVKVSLSELPEDFLKRHFYTNDDERNMITVIDELNELETEIIRENIKPTGMYTKTTPDGTSIVFSYAEDPNISHFILERYDETNGAWVPYDGGSGIIEP